MSGPIEGHRAVSLRRTVKVSLFGDNWQQQIAEAAAAAEAAERKYRDARDREAGAPRLMHEQPESDLLKVEWEQRLAEHDSLVAAARENGEIVVTLQVLKRRLWLELLSNHPPRTSDSATDEQRERDAKAGANDDTLAEDLLPASIVDVSPSIPVDDLLDDLSAAQWNLLYSLAYLMNQDNGPAPKALSSHSPNSDET